VSYSPADRAILAEYIARKPPVGLIADMFEAQRNFYEDKARFKAGLCTRRAGKSNVAARMLLNAAFEHPNRQSLYVALTRDSARFIMWPILTALIKKYGIKCKASEHKLIVTLPNGSTVRLVGADAKEDEKQKLLGQANYLIVIDECASFKPHIRALIEDVLEPTLVDYLGSMIMIGTPGDVAYGYFYEITEKGKKGWSLHKWTTYDNPHMKEEFETEIARKRENDPDIETRPSFLRQYRAKWVTDTNALIYKFDPVRNSFINIRKGRWYYSLGVDLGWDDPTAFTLIAWSYDDPCVYILDSWAKSEMILSKVSDAITFYDKQYGLTSLVVDNASKQAVEDMRSRYKHPFKAAEKQGKADFIGIFNDNLTTGKIKLGPACDELVTEWQNLVWAKEKVPKIEDPKCANHCADSALYIYRDARHYLYEKKDTPPKRDDPERAQWEADRMEQQEVEQWEAEQNKPWWDS